MYITRDYLKVGSWQAIIDMINDVYNFQLYPGIVKLKAMTPLGRKLTQVEIIPNRSTNPNNLLPVITQTVFKYERLDCTEFFRNTIAVNVSGLKLPISTFDILKQIGDRNEIVFEPDDFIHQTFESYNVAGDADLVIQASELSLRFVGQLKVRLINTSKRDISKLNTKPNEFPLVTVKPDTVKMRGDYLLSRYDFTVHRDSLKDVPVGAYNVPTQFLGPIYKATGLLFFCTDVVSSNNLTFETVDGEKRCKILYNGAPIPLWSNRTDIDRVLVIELSDTLCDNVSGFLRLHYN